MSADEAGFIIYGVLHRTGWTTRPTFHEPMLIRQEEILRRFSSVRVYGLDNGLFRKRQNRRIGVHYGGL